MTTRTMINRLADRPLYKQLADVIRTQIESGELAPGQRLPGENDYTREFALSRDSVRRALAILRNEGLITTSNRGPDSGSHVRPRADRALVRLVRGRVSARMPTEPERRKLDVSEGVPILVIEHDGQDPEIHPADRTTIQIGHKPATRNPRASSQRA